MAELEKSLLGEDRGVGVGRGGIDADQVGGEFVDADGLLAQVPLQGAESGARAESSKPIGEAVVVGVGGPDGLAQKGGEGALVLGDPGLDVVEAVVPLRDEEEEPDGENLARCERALPVERCGEVAVESGRQVQPLEGGPEDGEVGHGFDTHNAGFGGVHPASLSTFHFPHPGFPKPNPTQANRRLKWLFAESCGWFSEFGTIQVSISSRNCSASRSPDARR